MTLFTIGFTKKSAEEFFEKILAAGVCTLIDVRLHNTSQLAAFTKRDDLAYLLRKIGNIVYLHKPEWAPTADILSAYQKREISWNEYESRFKFLLRERSIQNAVPANLDGSCLLCSEPTAEKCHRRLVAEYLQCHFPDLAICHL